MNKFFITGANGFVGQVLCRELKKRSIEFKAGVRSAKIESEVSYGDFVTQNNWASLLQGCQTVVHLAARVHVMKEKNSDPLDAFMQMNCEATYRLALAAKEEGVKRFIFISSVKVNGEATFDTPFSPEDVPAPLDPYGVSKAEAEKKLMSLHQPGQFEVVIIRPPLIYGPGVKANFSNLYHFVKKDLPLPFGCATKNRRSLVSVFNLVDLIILCSEHPEAAGQIFMVSDGADLSLKQLIIEMGKSAGKTPHLLPVPVSILKMGASLIGKKDYAGRLFGNLQVDITKTKKLLNWSPLYSIQNTLINL